jgi:phosphoglycerate dehydrogenase-like enzyme
MKINTARGGVVDSPASLKALKDGQIAGTGLDVLTQKAPARFDALVAHRRSVITPHMAFNSEESAQDLQTYRCGSNGRCGVEEGPSSC